MYKPEHYWHCFDRVMFTAHEIDALMAVNSPLLLAFLHYGVIVAVIVTEALPDNYTHHDNGDRSVSQRLPFFRCTR